MHIKNSIKALTAISILIASHLVNADEKFDDLMELSLEELLQIKVIGSTKTENTLLNVPSSVTVYTNEEINRLGVSSLGELLKYVPGIQARRNGNNSLSYFVSTRGYISGTSNRNILILIDGQRLNSDVNGGVGVQYSRIPIENASRVEFIRGAASSLYGSNAFAAVINITTFKDKKKIITQISQHSSSFLSHYSTQVNKFEFSSFIKAIKDNGVDYSNLVDTIGNGVTSTKDPYNSFDLYLQTSYQNFSVYLSHQKRRLERFYILRRLSNRNYRNNNRSHFRLTYDFEITNTLQSQIALSYLETSDDIFVELGPEGNVFTQAPLLAHAKIQEKIPSVEWFNSYTLNDSHSLQFGLEYRNPEVNRVTVDYNYDIINPVPQIPFYNPDFYQFPLGKETAREILGIYSQYQGQVLEDVHLTLGLRYDNYSDFGDSLNPKAAIVYSPYKNTSFKLLFSEAFRAPSRNELDLVNNGVLLGNTNLLPETTHNYEAIIIQQFEKQSFSLSYYVNQIDDIIIEVSQPDGTNLRENAAYGKFRGTEIEYIGEVLENFQVRASYSHIISKPDFAFKSSDNIFSTSLNYSNNTLNINLSAFYHSAVNNDNNGNLTKISSFTVFNTKLNHRVSNKTKIFFQIENLFDKKYFAPSAGSSLTFDVPGRGRESFIGIEWSF